LVADSHLGFDLPARPRVERRRRGHDFLANHAAALAAAAAGEVDLVVHGGDVFHRPRVPSSLAWQAYEPLIRIAEEGTPVFVVPGNHERGRLPHARLAIHPRLHVFDRPRTHVVEVAGTRVALAGFPFERGDIRTRFRSVLVQTGWDRVDAGLRLLCMHQCVEGATVGPNDFTFTTAPDVIRGAEIPSALACVLSGHIHRHQVLREDLRGRSLAAPVLYPGSIERTSLAEKDEAKGYMTVDVSTEEAAPGPSWSFHRLYARPMLDRDVDARGSSAHRFEAAVRAAILGVPPDAVLRIRVRGRVTPAMARVVSAARLRTIAPPTMNVDIRGDGLPGPGSARRGARGGGRGRERWQGSRAPDEQLDLGVAGFG
jgi:exonuclease SbcD